MTGPDPLIAYLIAYLAENDAPCPGCGYNLRGLQQSQCPECGRMLNLREFTASRMRIWKSEIELLITVGNTVPILVSTAFVSTLCFTSLGFDSAMALGWLAVLIGHLVAVWIVAGPGHRRILRSPKWVILFNPFLICLILYATISTFWVLLGYPTV